jgi:hypothetical protein
MWLEKHTVAIDAELPTP